MTKPTIGFIGQGFIGKNYADNYESRGYDVVRYSLEEPYARNKDSIKDCDIVFIAVPTPTTKKGFDISFVKSAIENTKTGQSIVIKSTLAPQSTKKLATQFSDRFIFHSPEFLSERSAKHDVDKPYANVLGIPLQIKEYKKRAEKIISTFPKAPFSLVCTSLEAELIKYSRNIHGFFEVMFYNLFYDYVSSFGADYEIIKKYIEKDPLQVSRYATPFHASGHDLKNPKRGAGGHCYIKDFRSFSLDFKRSVGDKKSEAILSALEKKNVDLLVKSKKDLNLLRGVYGEKFAL